MDLNRSTEAEELAQLNERLRRFILEVRHIESLNDRIRFPALLRHRSQVRATFRQFVKVFHSRLFRRFFLRIFNLVEPLRNRRIYWNYVEVLDDDEFWMDVRPNDMESKDPENEIRQKLYLKMFMCFNFFYFSIHYSFQNVFFL